MKLRARRLLLIPAVVLVVLGAPAVALDGSPTPAPEATEVPVLPDVAVPGERAAVKTEADLVGVKWKGDPEAEFTIEVKKPGSDKWEPAATLGGDDLAPDEGSPDARAAEVARDGANVSEPVWVEDASQVRVTVKSGVVEDVSVAAVTADGGKAPSGSAGSFFGLTEGGASKDFAIALVVTGVVLGAVALGWTPWRSRRQLAVVAVVVVALVAAACEPAPIASSTLTPQPPITTRAQWGPDLPWNSTPDCAAGPEYALDLHFVVVHHTVNSNTYGPAESRNMVRAIWAYHVQSLGYCDIAYNFIIDRFGQIFEGRRGGMDRPVIAAHSGGFNRESTGIALLGDHSVAPVPKAAWDSLVQLTAWKLSVHMKNPAEGFYTTSGGNGARWPAGQIVYFPNRIISHRDVWPTACPGEALYARLPELRAAVQPKIGWNVPPTTAPPSTTTTTTTTTSPPAAKSLAVEPEPPTTTTTLPTTTTTSAPTTTTTSAT